MQRGPDRDLTFVELHYPNLKPRPHRGGHEKKKKTKRSKRTKDPLPLSLSLGDDPTSPAIPARHSPVFAIALELHIN